MYKKIVAVSMMLVMPIAGMEVGKHDGGEYCYRNPDSNSLGIYPTLQERQDLIDTYYQDVDYNVCKHTFLGEVDFQAIRDQFPIFEQKVNGYPLIYLDSVSTAQMPQVVLDAITAYYHDYKSNVGRGIYLFAEKATNAFETTRAKVAHFIGAKKQEIVFTQGTTASINLVAQAWAEHNLKAGDEIIVSEVEHNANFLPWQHLAQKNNLVLKVVAANHKGLVDADMLQRVISDKTKLVAITHQSNVLGSSNDIAALAQVAHEVGAKISVDAAQSIVHQKIDVKALDCDFLSFSAHKMYGPTGIGALYIHERLFDELAIPNFGGGMVYSVGVESSEFKPMPHCLEAGTQPIAQVIGLGAAIDFIQNSLDFKQVQKHETKLVQRFIDGLKELPGVEIISAIPEDGDHNAMVVFISDDHHAYDIAEYLNEYGIAVRAGYHCVHLYHQKLGERASVRVSFSIYNTQEEVDFVLACLKKLLVK